MHIKIKILKEKLVSFYEKKNNYASDCGVDLYNEMVIIPRKSIAFSIGLGVSCEPDTIQGYYLYPRSSFGKTGLVLGNHVGIIDPSYRGEITAKVHNFTDEDILLPHGTSLFQLCAPDLTPLNVTFTDVLSTSERGDKGFGSTNSV